MGLLINDSISPKELAIIFNDSQGRNTFIWGYKGFGTDGNDEFYCNFIDKYICVDRFKIQKDAIELTIALDLYKEFHLDIINRIIRSRRNEDLKLLCLDWLFNFFDRITKSDFERLNRYALNKYKNELLKVQAAINLLLLGTNIEPLKIMKRYLSNTTHATVCCRVISSLNNSMFDEIDKKVKLEIQEAIHANGVLTGAQKLEFNLI